MAHLSLVSSMLAAVGLLVFSIEAYSVVHPCGSEPCQVSPLCSTVRDLIWATDGTDCFVFQNGCFLANEICERLNHQGKKLEPATEAACRELCDGPCTREFNPRCAIYADGRNQTFSNPCVLKRETCSRADPPLVILNSTCSNPNGV